MAWENVDYYCISSKDFLVLQDIWNEVTKHERP